MSLQDKPDTLRTTPFREKLRVRFLSNHLRLFKDVEKTLDIGCGWGFSLKINPNFYCVDADVNCVEYLKSIGAKVSLADISKPLPFPDGSFDNAFTHDVLEHLEEEEMLSLFRDARRILKAGGVFMNIVPNLKGYLAYTDVGHKRYVTLKEIKSAANQTGFEVIDHWHTPFPRIFSELFKHNKLVVRLRAI
ncbi:class I SAM-dependent methyltransferase [Polynucleobacter sp. AM-7D1]|uniref:class I SAM-dependent methyltransferase n=1 Tax=Polynucleobacter sp. AM-7D1 TaxID=2689102 RepID=UPI001BFDB1EC|nr:class I SAM-dependent methyltransferase [Polynucleobacter sp. AM-7D1]QWE29010.1 class I SAM-dependent methyltransferase [Polynucleobacter sp. AM-7D1]